MSVSLSLIRLDQCWTNLIRFSFRVITVTTALPVNNHRGTLRGNSVGVSRPLLVSAPLLQRTSQVQPIDHLRSLSPPS